MSSPGTNSSMQMEQMVEETYRRLLLERLSSLEGVMAMGGGGDAGIDAEDSAIGKLVPGVSSTSVVVSSLACKVTISRKEHWRVVLWPVV